MKIQTPLGKLEESQMKPSTYLKNQADLFTSISPSENLYIKQDLQLQREKKLNCVKLKELLVKMK